MKTALAILIFGLSVGASAAEPAGFQFPRATPESQGISSAAILDFVETADREIEVVNSFMLVRHGKVVAECWWRPYDASTPHQLYSLSKSFTSTAAGMAIAEGKFTLDDRVLSFFPQDAPDEPSEHLRAMRVRDLLSMSTGHASEPRVSASDQPWTRTFLAHPVVYEPGTHFLYNTSATYMVSAIIQKQTGQTVLSYLTPRLFEPLGIENPTWGTSPQGITLGGYGLSVRTEDIARLGQFYLQKGQWNGRQLLPADWVETATSKQISNGTNPESDWNQGYGFQFWRCRHNCFRGDGAFGQYCIVMPDQDAVVAITSGVRNMQAVLNLVWDKLLPAMKSDALPENSAQLEAMQKRFTSLLVPTQKGDFASPMAKSVSGKSYQFDTNDQKIESVSMIFSEDSDPALVLHCDGTPLRTVCGLSHWVKGEMTLPGYPLRKVAVSGAWTAEDMFAIKICLYETPHIRTLRLKFDEDQLTLDSEMNVAFGRTRQPQLIGTIRKPSASE